VRAEGKKEQQQTNLFGFVSEGMNFSWMAHSRSWNIWTKPR